MRLHRLAVLLVLVATLVGPARAFDKRHASFESTLDLLLGGNRVYRLSVLNAGSGCGTWTATTGSLHPSGPAHNIFFGNGFPASSDTTFRSYTSSTDYRTGSECTPLCATAAPVLTLVRRGTGVVGFRLTWTFEDGRGGPVVEFSQEVAVTGPVDGTETVDNSAIRETHTVRNLGPGELRYGVRKQWDWEIDGNDGPWFGDCRTPDRACDSSLNLTAGGSSGYPRNYLVNEQPSIVECPAGIPPQNPDGCAGVPFYVVAGTVTPPSNLSPPPDAPELLQFNSWPILFGSCWEPPLLNAAACQDGDTAVAYFYGRTAASAHVLAVGEARSYTQYVVAGVANCPAPIQEVDSDAPVCSVTIEPGAPPIARGTARDDRPSEDLNGNGVLDEGEDVDGDGLIDRDTGIYVVELAPGAVNLTLAVDSFVPGDPMARFGLAPTDPTLLAVGVTKVTDGAGNSCEAPIVLATCPEGLSCDDGNPCTTDDRCDAGRCVGGPPIDCDDGSPCTIDRCDPSTGCSHTQGADSDGDGIGDCNDACPHSFLDPTVVIPPGWVPPVSPGTAPGTSLPCDSGAPNSLLDGGCTISDQIAVCDASSRNRGQFERCVRELLGQLERRHAITQRNKKAIDRCIKEYRKPDVHGRPSGTKAYRSGAGRPQRP